MRTISWKHRLLDVFLILVASAFVPGVIFGGTVNAPSNSGGSTHACCSAKSAELTLAGNDGEIAYVKDDFSHGLYADVLQRFVDERGRVGYEGLKANRENLDAYAAAIASLSLETYETWSDEEKLAFWMNTYNALTLKLIVDRYPIESSFFTSMVFPKKSIRQIPGAWDDVEFIVMGKPMVLDEIEHEIIRKRFGEPRIHMALVCAAISCPILRNEPYDSAHINEQLSEQSRSFVADPSKFRIDKENGVVYLSKIFDWYGDDFVGKYGSQSGSNNRKEEAVIDFVKRHLPEEDQTYLAEGSYDIRYLKYDWTLNDQALD
ncbi:MAG: DUF547 domain-containing protein [Candidatus Latescibacteria bacterium]|nr:DUF547 domain-containing protein [Candidatus Latescibacterota bacterium]NIM21810.1 DUF547 domain-containing protein [Candidatus Latescibacterota bacterium]NIM65948.1 DUF547 domain-containing protein [Candidatus Latescibacterota bacterium]NIO02693.1 DUF547 domain-containing protein [Candidatus Latescibacterota bacterium]NIO29674.1 DUF547 domain-containing protein [Candidatus Latescibacterota bacterium]